MITNLPSPKFWIAKPLIYGAGVLFLFVTLFAGAQTLRLSWAQTDLAKCETAKVEQKGAIEAQNTAIKADKLARKKEIETARAEVEAIKAKHAAQIKTLAKLAEDALIDRSHLKATVKRLMAEDVPETCSGALEWQTQTLNEANKLWLQDISP